MLTPLVGDEDPEVDCAPSHFFGVFWFVKLQSTGSLIWASVIYFEWTFSMCPGAEGVGLYCCTGSSL